MTSEPASSDAPNSPAAGSQPNSSNTSDGARTNDPAGKPADAPAGQPVNLAKQLTGWTINGFAMAVVIVTGLAVGRQTLHWWRGSRPSPQQHAVTADASSAGDQAFGDVAKLHAFEFGNRPGALATRSFTGSESGALAELALLCRRVIASRKHKWRPPLATERRLLASTAARRPAASQSGRWEVHQLSGPLLLSVGIMHLKPPAAADAGGSGAPQRCVVCWGIAAPQLDAKGAPRDKYSLYVYSPQAPAGSAVSPLAELPWPAFLQPSLAIHSPAGDTVTGLSGSGRLASCEAFFDTALTARQFTRSKAWRDTTQGDRSARFDHPTRGHVVVQLSQTAGGGVQGVASYMSR